MRRVTFTALLCAACLDFEGPTQNYCINHPDLCTTDAGSTAGGSTAGGSTAGGGTAGGGSSGGRAGGSSGGQAGATAGGGSAGGTAGGAAGGSAGGAAGGTVIDAGFECAPYDGGFRDETGGTFNVFFAEDGGPYLVRVGNNVGWTGITASHPLRQICGPVRFLQPDWVNDSQYMQLPQPGRFGFYCAAHGDRHQLFEAVP